MNSTQINETYWPNLYRTIPGKYTGAITAYDAIKNQRIQNPGCTEGFKTSESFTYNVNTMVQRPVDGFANLHYDPVGFMTVTPGYWRSQGTYNIDF